MPTSSIPKMSNRTPVRKNTAQKSSFLTIFLCLLLTAYIVFIAVSLMAQDDGITPQTAATAETLVSPETGNVDSAPTGTRN